MSNFKPPSLCISRDLLPLPQRGYGLFPLELSEVDPKAFHFINRDIVDNSEDSLFKIGKALPQLLAYVVIKCGDEYLTYSRKTGAESRLHGSRSIGFGGHVDLEDYDVNEDEPFINSITTSVIRELKEELKYQLNFQDLSKLFYDQVILDTTNSVGQVHLGLPIIFEIDSKDLVAPDPTEISDSVWVTNQELKRDIKLYENWSQILITTF